VRSQDRIREVLGEARTIRDDPFDLFRCERELHRREGVNRVPLVSLLYGVCWNKRRLWIPCNTLAVRSGHELHTSTRSYVASAHVSALSSENWLKNRTISMLALGPFWSV
jgi:hypothetical protein